MAPRFVFLSYPIDRVPAGAAMMYERLEDAKIQLLEQGVDIVFDPGDAFKVLAAAEVGPEVREINQLALSWADGVLAMLPDGIPSLGVPMEIDSAVRDGKVVAILTDVKAWMLGFSVDANVEMFPLSEVGFAQAAIWLAAHPRATIEQEPKEQLPFVVTAKAECGKTEAHGPHNFGEYFEEDCAGMADLTPRKTYPSDAGFDLVVAKTMTVWEGEQVDVPMGVAVQLPPWSFGRITGRSSTLRRRGLLVNEGIIDESYRGDLFALVKNLSHQPVQLKRGDRIAQLILHSNVSTGVEMSKVQDLAISARGERGFGSSGT